MGDRAAVSLALALWSSFNRTDSALELKGSRDGQEMGFEIKMAMGSSRSR